MSNLVRVRNGVPQWPYTVSQLRIDEPQISLSSSPSEAELTALATLEPPILVFVVRPTAQPTFDPATQVVVPAFPELVSGQWEQRWTVQDLPPRPADQPGFVVNLVGPVIDNTVSPPSYTYSWEVIELPPDYEGLHRALTDSALMDTAERKLTPVLSLGEFSGRAQSGGSNFLILAATAAIQNGAYVGSLMLVTSGLGAGESFICISYDGTTKRADLQRLTGNGTALALDGTTRYRMYPLDRLYTSLDAVNGVYANERTTRQFMAILEALVQRPSQELSADTPALVTRFQSRLTAWVAAVGFTTQERADLQSLLNTFCPTRSYVA